MSVRYLVTTTVGDKLGRRTHLLDDIPVTAG